MIKRILLALLLAWTAIAPAIASSCAAGCEARTGSMQHHAHEQPDTTSPDVPDCHGIVNEQPDSNTPEGGTMELACLVASIASIPSAALPLVKVDLASEPRSVVLLPAVSFHTSAPPRPPQA